MPHFFHFIILAICIQLVPEQVMSQTNEALSKHLISSYFQEPTNGTQAKRGFIRDSSQLNVLHKAAGGLIYFYQNIVSEQIQADCTYEITCSQYIKLCIERYGFFKGSFAGLNQYMKCSPDNHANHALHRLNNDNKIMNSPNDEQ